MYIVRNKATQEVIHTNPAPLKQRLTPAQVYYAFDPETMEIGRTDSAPPEHWDIDSEGLIYELPLSDQVARGLTAVPNGHKLDGEAFVPLDDADRVARGDLKIETVADTELTRLRAEITSIMESGRTPANHRRMDQLTREKMAVSAGQRALPASNAGKKALLEARIIYPDEIYDEIAEGIQAAQLAYRAAAAAVAEQLQADPPDIAAARAITVRNHLEKGAVVFL